MYKSFKIFRYVLLSACLFVTPVFISAQDLGSSSGIFRSSNPKTKKPATKPATVKPKTAPKQNTSRRKSSAKSTTRKTTPTKRASSRTGNTGKATTRNESDVKNTDNQAAEIIGAVDSEETVADNENENSIVITVGDPANNEFNELFEKAIDEGNNFRNDRNYQKAEAAYLRAQSLQNKDSRAVYGLGNLYSDQNRWDEAETAYRTAIALEPNSPQAYVALSYVLTRPIIGANLPERYAEAEKTARTAIRLEPKNAVAFDQLGVALELRGLVNSTETENSYRRAIKYDPNFALAYAHLGRLLRRRGKIKESSEAYQNAINFSTEVPTMILVADVMQSQQRYIESEELLRRALSEDPKNPTALFLLGRALTTRGSYEEAEKVLKKSASVSPNSFVSYMLLGSMFARRGEYGDAEKYLDKAAKMVSENEKRSLAQEFENVGDRLLSVGKLKDAVRVYKKAQKLAPGNPALTEKLSKIQNN